MTLNKLFHNVNVDNFDKDGIGIGVENNSNKNEKCINNCNNHKIRLNNWKINYIFP